MFLTGSDTSANALFGNLQVVTANQLRYESRADGRRRIPRGGVMGKMISLTSIAVASAATGMARTTRPGCSALRIAIVCFLATVIGLIVIFYAYVAPHSRRKLRAWCYRKSEPKSLACQNSSNGCGAIGIACARKRPPLRGHRPQEWTDQDFFASGEEAVAGVILDDWVDIYQGKDPAEMRVLEIGCGAGRLPVRFRNYSARFTRSTSAAR